MMWRLNGTSLVAALAVCLVSLPVAAERIAIVGGTVYGAGADPVENATVLVDGSTIVSVTGGGTVPAGYRVIDATGKWVTPGLMVASSTLGLGEVSLSAGIVDATVKKTKSTLSLEVPPAFNPDTTLIPVTRIEGITRAVTGFARTEDMWQGLGAVIHLGSEDAPFVEERAFLHLNVSESGANRSGGSRAALWQAVFAKLDAAGADNGASADGKEGDGKKPKKPDPEKQVLQQLLSGDLKLVVTAQRKSDILQVLRLQDRYGLDIVLAGAVEAWRVADRLAQAGIPVVLDATDNLPQNFETLAASQANAARLHAAGVRIAFTGSGSHNARLAPQYAGNAVANGLPWQAAFDGLTRGAAEIFGISDRYGTLQAGKDADVVVWSGDPLELMTDVEAVLIRGEQIALESRQTKLADRYKSLVRSPAYRK